VGGDVIVSSYGDGVVARHPLAGNGSAGEFAQALAPTFGDAEPNRGGGHAHCSLLLPDGRVATLDLGADAVHVHTIGEDGALVRVATTWLTPGSGPRHMALHPSGQLYVLCELANVVAILDSDLAVIDYTEAAPADAGDASEIAIGSDGRFVYAAIRDADILVVFRVEDGGRRLVRVADVPTGGRGPRHFVVLGERILVGNQLTNTVDVFDIGSDGVPVHRRQLPVKSPTFLLPL
jgi:6-phosphogluconolactonase